MLANKYNFRIYVARSGYVSIHYYTCNMTEADALGHYGFKWRVHGPSMLDCYVTSRLQMRTTIPLLISKGLADEACMSKLKLALCYAEAPTTDKRLEAVVELRKIPNAC